MKLTNPSKLALLLTAGAFFPLLAKADLPATTVYTEGDILIGFHQIGTGASPNDLVVDVGPASQFLNAANNGSAPFTLTFGLNPSNSTTVTSLAADLSSVFGPGWASNSASALLQFGLFGDTTVANDFGISGLPKNTLFLTTGETIPGTHADPLLQFRATPDGVDARNINSVTVGAFGFNGSAYTANDTQAVSQPTSQSNSYISASPNSNAFGTGYDIEQPTSGNATGPTNSVLDLYELQPDTQDGNPGRLLGTLNLNSSGVLTFSPVPEPNSLALLALTAGLSVGITRRRRRA